MILGAHQPNLMPWLGFFDKVLRSDVFVLVDHVQFERQNYQNRTRIKTRAGASWLAVPVHQRSRSERIFEKTINTAPDGRITWSEKLLRTVHHAYGRAPHYERYRGKLEDLFDHPFTHLVDLNEALIRWLMAELEITTPLVRSSDLEGIAGQKSEMILSLCRAVKADGYLSGAGGSLEYLDRGAFARAGIEVTWQTFEHPTYAQVSPPAEFIPRLSALDLMFNHGPASAQILRSGAASAPASATRTEREHAA